MVGVVIGLALLATWLYALFDSVTTPEDKIRYLQKPLWVLIVLIGFPPIGAIAWLFFGKIRVGTADSSTRSSFGDVFGTRTASKPRRTIAPDDDPEFLRGLNRPNDDSR